MTPSSAPTGMPTASTPPPDRTTAYGQDPAQVYDVRLPSAPESGATVVVVHGGFWRREWDREHAGAQAQGFADAGHHVAVVEYRRTGMPGGGWPGTFQDVSAAIRAIRADPTLPDRCLLVGHSAGGHLVALAAAQPWAHGLAGAVSLAGCVDLALSAEMDLGGGAPQAFLGGPWTDGVTGSWADADPALHVPTVPMTAPCPTSSPSPTAARSAAPPSSTRRCGCTAYRVLGTSSSSTHGTRPSGPFSTSWPPSPGTDAGLASARR